MKADREPGGATLTKRLAFYAHVGAFLLLSLQVIARPSLSGAQQPARGDGPYTVQKSVRRVVLDVVVSGEDREHVRGLSARAFSVYDNGRPEKILSFEERDFDIAGGAAGGLPANLPKDTFVNVPRTPERGPLYVLVYDMVDTGWGDHYEDQIVARQTLEKFLLAKPEGARCELYVLSTSLELVQGFTSDPEQLLRAFDDGRQGEPVPWTFLYRQNYGREIVSLPFQAMTSIARDLEGLPGRKNLIWISSEFKVGVPVAGPAGGRAAGMAAVPTPGAHSTAAPGSEVSAMGDTMRDAADALSAAEVSVYPVDVQGLNPNAPQAGIDLWADEVARETGGKAYYNTNDLVGAIRDAVVNGGTYYEMSYAPADARYDGELHRIELKLDRGGAELQYRRFYYADDPSPRANREKKESSDGGIADPVLTPRPGDTVYAWMRHGAPDARDILFRAHVSAGPDSMATAEQMAKLVDQPAYFVLRKANKQVAASAPVLLRTYTIDYLVADRAAEQRQGDAVLEFAACAYDARGRMMNGISQQAVRTATEPRGRTGKGGWFRAVQTLEVPDGAEWLRVAVRDTATDRIGTIEIPLPIEEEPAKEAKGAGQPGAGAR